ncbi:MULTISPECIES: hypothetical protein [unclassified Mucilaginibacter]|uniref:hypothetical protein n=1 Tax=unclassified Mucilaginibacter TaxID=2617802 RepID=UPI00339A0A9C
MNNLQNITKSAILIFAMAFAACSGSGNKSADTTMTASSEDTSNAAKLNTPSQNMEYCFTRTDGTSAQDTTAIHLVINGNKVSGDMRWIPKEKDSRKGTLLGTIKGNTINAVWSFMQEGMQDTIAVEFKLAAQQLSQKPLKLNTSTGREQLDKNADYTINYKLDNCEKFKSSPKPTL